MGSMSFISQRKKKRDTVFSNDGEIALVIHEIPDPAPIKILLGMNFIKNVDLRVNGRMSLGCTPCRY